MNKDSIGRAGAALLLLGMLLAVPVIWHYLGGWGATGYVSAALLVLGYRGIQNGGR